MRPFVLAVVALVAAAAAPLAGAQPQQVLFPGLEGQPLLDAVRAAYAPDQTLGYDVARDSLFLYEMRADGALACAYTGFAVVLTPGADPSTDAFERGINTEHTWPQSWGASTEPSRSDLHHLFPARDNVNSARGNHPFAEIPDADATAWYRLDQAQANVPPTFLDEWSEKANSHPMAPFVARFEPREDHAGDAARAAFYYRAVYPDRVAAEGADDFFEVQREAFLAWQRTDPVDAEEYARMEWIAGQQGRANPFVLDSTLARRAYGERIDVGGGSGPGGAALVWVNELHYDDEGADANEFIELAVPQSITEMASVLVTLYNGNGGLVYDSLSGAAFTRGASAGGFVLYVLTLPPNGLQNGPPDGLAVSVDGELVQFLSYEGVFAASEGPAAGFASTDMGVAETGTTAEGSALRLTGAGAAYDAFAWAPSAPASPGAVNAGQSFTPVAVEPGPGIHRGLALGLGGPNPFRDRTALTLTLDAPQTVRVEVLDVLGRRVAVAHDGPLGPGRHAVPLDATRWSPGVYVVRAEGLGGQISRTLTVVR